MLSFQFCLWGSLIEVLGKGIKLHDAYLSTFLKKKIRNTIRVSNSLVPCLRRFSADDKSR